ncbi:GntR family transcriptional regulator [Paenactinomyces guangxiensis]|uniref:GntR family transcriptional regulator n=1 Tax=Paenactinomyces guangxiensis TaxID=1490290 RepID=A0A7W1WRR2_9BACL|nr:GntR family transcriptional regulator [Paenactinomyces guangxiensis]MBA4494782.1 GntR family transcriptional regulator [Paenactinomyces guangxiensis]MBH8591866.1 GntR family transcriptional regulator [Paenactinomyces guangxiensis]
MSKYEQISNEMRRRITEDCYPVDQPIPDELSLAKEFGCSRMTMKRALDILVMEGLLYRKRGHGTFIVKSAIQKNHVNVVSEKTIGLTKVLKGEKITSKIIRFEVLFPSEEVAAHLNIDTNSPVYHVIRLRIVKDEPYVLERTYMPTHLITDLNEEVLYSSVYHHITHTLGLTIAGSHRKIRACKPNELDQKYLGCAPDDPVLELEQVGFLNTGIPFEYTFARHRYDKFLITTVSINK